MLRYNYLKVQEKIFEELKLTNTQKFSILHFQYDEIGDKEQANKYLKKLNELGIKYPLWDDKGQLVNEPFSEYQYDKLLEFWSNTFE